MIDAGKLLGSLMQGGMNGVGGERLQNAFGSGDMGDLLGGLMGGSQQAAGGGGMGDLLGGLMGGKQAPGGGGMGDLLGGLMGGKQAPGGGGIGDLLGGLMGGGQQAGGGMGDLLGSLMGGKGQAGGGGAMAALGMLAMNALKNSGGSKQMSSSMQLTSGLRAPQNAAEQREVEDAALLTLKAMINAAKADGKIDQAELDKIVGKLREDGADAEEQAFIRQELNAPMDTDGLVAAVSNPQVGLQLYTASLLAITVDTEAERVYLRELAAKLNLDHGTVQQMNSLLGVN